LKIDPPLTFNEYYDYFIRYLEMCFEKDPYKNGVLSRCEAGWEFASWFSKCWHDENVDRKYLIEMKKWIAELYKKGDKNFKQFIEVCIFETIYS